MIIDGFVIRFGSRHRTSSVLSKRVAVGTLCVLLSACGKQAASPATTGVSQAPAATSAPTTGLAVTPTSAAVKPTVIELKLVAFRPESTTVAVGSTVQWKQLDSGVHTVTSGLVEQGAAGVKASPDGTFDSGDIANNGSFSFTFSRTGTYPYFCKIHPATMRGTVVAN